MTNEPELEWLGCNAVAPRPQPTELVDEHPEWGCTEAKVQTYNEFHELAVEMGFPSMTEAFERLSELEAQIAKLQADGDKLAAAAAQVLRETDVLDEMAIPSLADLTQALAEWKDRA